MTIGRPKNSTFIFYIVTVLVTFITYHKIQPSARPLARADFQIGSY